MLTALSISGVVQANYTSDYEFEAKLATTQTLPIKIEKTKIEVNELSLTQDAKVLEPKENCQIEIKIVAGESNLDRAARLVREEAERAAQAQAIEAVRAQERAKVKVLPSAGLDLGDAWLRLRMCESGNTYSRNSGNGYYGAYQFNISTWRSYAPAGYADVRPDLAPPAVQDQAALALYHKRGWQPWPACSRKLGLR
ncbi:transglycosylase family protein [Patescibacteria group bacterium]|nr:transglycosylase family protein [Patescibacteria group bacterium]